MPAPTGTVYPGNLDISTDIGSSVATGDIVEAAYADTQSSGILAIQTSLGTNPFGAYTDVKTALVNKVDANSPTVNANLDMAGYLITNLGTPTTSTDAATKGYADGLAQGLTMKQSVLVIASSNVNISTGGLLTIDGVTLTAGDRVLLIGQTNAYENGIYVAASGAWSRSSDANTSALVPSGMATWVTSGSSYANQGWVLITPGPITLGTTDLTFSQFGAINGAGSGVNSDITGMTGLTGLLQAPTQVNDVNGNAVLQFGSTASAVNHVEVTNAATGDGPTIAAAGSDTNINLNLATVGSGVVLAPSTQIIANGNTGLYVRGGPFSPTLPSAITGLVAWYKADAITGVSSGGSLATWPDSSSLSDNATASGSNEPTYYTGILNGLPAVLFNGTTSMMTLGTQITTAQTVFWILQETISSPNTNSFLGNTTDEAFLRGSSNQYWATGAYPNYVQDGITRLNGSVIYAPTTSVFPQGSFQIVSVVTTAAVNVGFLTGSHGNASQSWDGYIAEVIVYDVALSDANRALVEQYLANKYNLNITSFSPSGPPLLDLRDANNTPVSVVNFGGGQQIKLYTMATGSTYSASLGDYVIVVDKVSGSATTINLPATPATGQLMIVKDGKGDAATNNITINPASGGIDGAASLVITTNYGGVRLVYNGYQWERYLTPHSPAVKEYFLNRRFWGQMGLPDGEGQAQEAYQTQFIRIQLRLQGDVIQEIRFTANACMPTIACGSFVCDKVYGQSTHAALRLTADEIRTGLGGLTPSRHGSADLAVRALRTAIFQALGRTKGVTP